MRGHLALVLLGSLISRAILGGDLETVRVGRYSAIVPGPSPEQADPLAVPVHTELPLSVQTVGRAVEQFLAPTGYRLAHLHVSCPSLSALLDLPLPAVHRTLGPMRLDEALKTLAGPAHTLVIDPVHRLVSFELRARYASLAPAATPHAARKARVPAERVAVLHASRPLLPKTASGRRIGPIRQDAQLWTIAADLREAFRATTEQVMVGLYEANPGSFCHRNLHCLKVAAYLEVPQATRVAAIRPPDAHRMVQRHLEAWRHRSRRDRQVADVTPREVLP
ncbi:MAG: FimV/HubP family polar landmark protein [Gammaproteobacteria bacterium]